MARGLGPPVVIVPRSRANRTHLPSRPLFGGHVVKHDCSNIFQLKMDALADKGTKRKHFDSEQDREKKVVGILCGFIIYPLF